MGKKVLDKKVDIQFIRISRKETGLTPMRYVCKHKIDKAIGLLKSSDLNIAQIAEALRYPDQHTFSKAFKKENGLSPLYFRKKLPHLFVTEKNTTCYPR